MRVRVMRGGRLERRGEARSGLIIINIYCGSLENGSRDLWHRTASTTGTKRCGPSVSSFSDRLGSGHCLEAPTNGSFPSRCIFSPEPLSRPRNNFSGEHTAHEVKPYDVTRSLVSHLLCLSFLRAIPGSLSSDDRPPPISPLVFHLANGAQVVPQRAR